MIPNKAANEAGRQPPVAGKIVFYWRLATGDFTGSVELFEGLGERTGMDIFMRAAVEEAQKGLAEGGIPIGSVLVIGGEIAGRGYNRRVQKASAILHAEMDALENAGRISAADYRRAVLYSTLSPCDMCSGAALLYKIPKIVIGDNLNFRGPEEHVHSRGIELVILNDPECIRMMRAFIAEKPDLWNEDIGQMAQKGLGLHA